ncbi:MAG: SH3 domain-containing protein [Timaviella obliquedivisa GSE-PSE-MK23-08B]|jgi:hypothetical protein|nr:SH3 domain-containing protein [Timaviella obliquedivisa GSE-PSE-MK23-08B]
MNRFCWLAGALSPLIVLGFALPGWADVAVPMDDVLPKLQETTQIPILLPSQVPMDEVFLDVEAESDRYYVGFDYRPDCRSLTACHFGEIMAEQGNSMSAPGNAEKIMLADGTSATFFSTCGAHCTASVQWQYGGVMYRVMVKNGEREGTIALANSAILRGDRRSSSSSDAGSVARSSSSSTTRVMTPPSSGMARLKTLDSGSAINIRAEASTTAEILHMGYSGDRVEIISHVNGEGDYRWYNIRFPQSGAIGWVRGDFVVP